MSFLHPALLYLIPLAAIPIVLHLLMLHRLKTVELSTFRFLFDSYVQQRRRMKFLEALLAALRAAFLLFLVLLVARPALRHWGDLFRTGSGRDIVLLIDCSASMNAKTVGVSALDRAKSAAQSVLERLSGGDRVTLIRVTSRPQEIVSQLNTDAAAINEAIGGLEVSPARGNMLAALLHVFGPHAPRAGKVSVYAFTDCQKGGWQEADRQGLERLVPSDTEFAVINVGAAIPNVAVEGNPPRQQEAIVGLPITLEPKVVNYSKREMIEVTVSAFIDDKEISRATVTVKPGETATRKITYVPGEAGIHKGRFELTGKHADSFPDDDTYLFTLAVAPRVKVLLVNGHPSTDPFDSETLYLRAALTVDPDEGPTEPKVGDKNLTAMAPAGSGLAVLDSQKLRDMIRSLDVQEVEDASLTSESLRDINVVVLANCGRLNHNHYTWLQTFVAHGGGLLILPGDRVNSETYNRKLFPVSGPQNEFLTSARLEAPRGDLENADSFERLVSIDFSHPVWAVFDDPESRYLKGVRIFRRFPLTMPAGRENAQPLAEFSDGSPALVESRLGEGRVLLSAFPASAKWTNFPLKQEFVPFVLRLVSYAKNQPEAEGPPVVAPDATAEFRVAGHWAPANGKVVDVKGGTTPLVFERSGSRLAAGFEGTGEKGYYGVEVKGRADQGKTANLAFAVNVSREESDFTMLTESDFRELLPGASLRFVDASAEAQQLYGSIGNEQEIWRPLIWVLFAVIAVEFWLATSGMKRVGAVS